MLSKLGAVISVNIISRKKRKYFQHRSLLLRNILPWKLFEPMKYNTLVSVASHRWRASNMQIFTDVRENIQQETCPIPGAKPATLREIFQRH